MILKESIDREGSLGARNIVRNYVAALLFAGSVLGSNTLQAAQKYLGCTETEAKSMQEEFCGNLEKNMRDEFGGSKDFMLEALLGYDCDTTIGAQKEYQDRLRKKFDSILMNTLKESSFYKELRISLTEGLRNRLSGKSTGEDDSSYIEGVLCPIDQQRKVPERRFIGVDRLNPSLNLSLDDKGLDYTAKLGFDGLNVGGFTIDKGKIAFGRDRLNVELGKIISEELYLMLEADKKFDEPGVEYQANLGGSLGKNASFSIGASYSDGETSVNAGLISRF